MNSCEFCNNIQKYVEIKQGEFKGKYYPEKNIDSIVYDELRDTFDIWSDGGGDSFQAGIVVEGIRFCPKCGRVLKETYRA